MGHKADKELGALVAEKVLGWTLWDGGFPVKFWIGPDGLLTGWCDSDWPGTGEWGDAPGLFSDNGVWRPRIDIAATWVIVKALAQKDWHLVLYAPGTYTDEGLGPGKGWTALFYQAEGGWYKCEGAFDIETEHTAICLAALKAKKSQQREGEC